MVGKVYLLYHCRDDGYARTLITVYSNKKGAEEKAKELSPKEFDEWNYYEVKEADLQD